jgi:acyl-coenzyme A thioesterase PaaI-like protein
VLPYADKLIGNPMIPALHGGVTAAFLEVAAIMNSSRTESGRHEAGTESVPAACPNHRLNGPPALQPRDALCARAVNRSGRRYASVHVEAWQDNRAYLRRQRPFPDAIARRKANNVTLTHRRVLQIACRW